MESDLKLIQECGFNSFEEVVQKMNQLVDVMRVGRARAEKYLDRFTIEAKKLIKDGHKDKAKRELLKKKNHGERVKTIDTQLNIILEKLKEVKNSSQMVQVLKATKYCNNLLLSELGQKDLLLEKNEENENQDLIDNDKEISKYLDILTKSKPKKVKPVEVPVQNIAQFPEDGEIAQKYGNNAIDNNISFPKDNNNEDMITNQNFNQNIERPKNNYNYNNYKNNYKNNFKINEDIKGAQKNDQGMNINMNSNNNPNFNNYNNKYNYNQIKNQNNNLNNINTNNNYGYSNNNSNNYNNNNYNFNNNPNIKNPYDDIF